MNNPRTQLPALVAVAVLGVSCAAAPAKPQNVLEEAPAWVVRGGGYSSSPSGRTFLGVGRSSCAPTEVSRRDDTETRARVDLAANVSAYVADLVKAYVASTPEPADAQSIADALKALVAQQTATATIQDRWISKDGSTEFAETQLDLEGFKDSLLQVHALNDRMREIIKDRAVPAFDAMSKPEARNAPQP